MAAGFAISRILMFCLLNEVTYTSGLRAASAGYEAWQDGGQTPKVHGYRRPLHYVRSLRQPKLSPEHVNPFNTWQNPQRSLETDFNSGQTFRQTLGHLWPRKSPVQPAPQRNYPVVQPRSFKVSLDLPYYKPNQMKGTGSATGDYEQNDPILQTKQSVPLQSGFSISEVQSPQRDPKKDQNVRKNIHGASTSNLKVNPTISLLAAALKPLNISSRVANKDPGNIFQMSYMEPGKLSPIHVQQKSPTSQTGEQTRKQLGLTWSNYPDPGPMQTLQRPYESTYTQPTDDKLTVPAWQLNQHRNYENHPARQSLMLQIPDSINLPSLPVMTYLGLPKAQTSTTREDKVQSHSIKKLQFSPLQNRGSQDDRNVAVGSPSISQLQNSYTTTNADVKDLTSDQMRENVRDAAVPSLQLGFSFPIKSFLSNLTKGDAGYLNIKPQSLGSLLTHYMEATKPHSTSPQAELKLSVSGFDYAKQTNALHQRNWPVLNLDLGPGTQKQTPPVPVTTKPTHSKPNFSSWFLSRQVGQDETTRTQSLSPKKPVLGKPQIPVLAISKYLDLVDLTRPLKNDKYQTIQRKPLQSEGVQSLYSSLKPSTNSYVHGQTRPSVSLSSTHDSSPFKPSNENKPNVATHSSSHHPPLAYGLSSYNSPNLEAVPAEKPQTWPKQSSSLYHQYNSGRDASYDTTFEAVPAFHSRPSEFLSQNFPEQHVYGPNQDGKGYVKPFDTNFGGSLFGQTYLTGKNTAGTPFNVQPPCESSSSRLGHHGSSSDLRYPYLHAEPQPCSIVSCMDGVGKCNDELEKQSFKFPHGVSYSPTAEATSVSIPFSTFERVFTQSSYQPDQNGFKLNQHPVGQGRAQQLARAK